MAFERTESPGSWRWVAARAGVALPIVTRKLDAEIAVPAQCELAEGPVWDAARGLLRWVDILRGRVHALDPVSGAHSWFETGDEVGTAGLTRDGGLVLALSDRFARCDHDGQNLRRLDGFTVDGSVFRFNDGKPDPWGNFWAGTCTLAEKGPPCTLYKLSPDGAVTELFGDIGLSNGLDWSDDRRVFYYSDSHAGEWTCSAPTRTPARSVPAGASPRFPAGCPTA